MIQTLKGMMGDVARWFSSRVSQINVGESERNISPAKLWWPCNLSWYRRADNPGSVEIYREWIRRCDGFAEQQRLLGARHPDVIEATFVV